MENENAYSEMLYNISPSYYNIWLNNIYIYTLIATAYCIDYMANNIYQTSVRERWFVQIVDTQVLRYDNIIRYLTKDISKLCILERMLLLRIAIIAVSVASKQQTKHGAYRIRVFYNFCELSALTQLGLPSHAFASQLIYSSISNSKQLHLFSHIFTQGQFRPSGIVIACVCVSVHECVYQSLGCPHDNSSAVEARITKFGPEMQAPCLGCL